MRWRCAMMLHATSSLAVALLRCARLHIALGYLRICVAYRRKPLMDLGIKGKKAIVCAASKGLGKGCAQALAREGVEVVICARGAETLTATARELAATGVNVTPVVCDVTTEGGRKALLAACTNPDILINNAGGQPPGDFKDFFLDEWRKAVQSTQLTPT